MRELANVLQASEPATLPDVATYGHPLDAGCLDRVGMTGIETLVTLAGADDPLRLPARVDAFVSLDEPRAKGIHMSRILLATERLLASRELTPGAVADLLRAFVEGQRGLSRSAHVAIRVDYPLERESLLSGETGTRIYPLRFEGSLARGGLIRAFLGTVVTYSSSCPCSASLAQGLLRERFVERFGALEKLSVAEVLDWLQSEDGTPPVPHSQRSRADVCVELDWGQPALDPSELIDRLERALGTPVQAAVKRIDEREFARLNGLNPLFCEDAARRLAASLAIEPRIRAYRIEVHHEESLHAHNAVAAVASPSWPATERAAGASPGSR